MRNASNAGPTAPAKSSQPVAVRDRARVTVEGLVALFFKSSVVKACEKSASYRHRQKREAHPEKILPIRDKLLCIIAEPSQLARFAKGNPIFPTVIARDDNCFSMDVRTRRRLSIGWCAGQAKSLEAASSRSPATKTACDAPPKP
jgi:hypothetical protein